MSKNVHFGKTTLVFVSMAILLFAIVSFGIKNVGASELNAITIENSAGAEVSLAIGQTYSEVVQVDDATHHTDIEIEKMAAIMQLLGEYEEAGMSFEDALLHLSSADKAFFEQKSSQINDITSYEYEYTLVELTEESSEVESMEESFEPTSIGLSRMETSLTFGKVVLIVAVLSLAISTLVFARSRASIFLVLGIIALGFIGTDTNVANANGEEIKCATVISEASARVWWGGLLGTLEKTHSFCYNQWNEMKDTGATSVALPGWVPYATVNVDSEHDYTPDDGGGDGYSYHRHISEATFELCFDISTPVGGGGGCKRQKPIGLDTVAYTDGLYKVVRTGIHILGEEETQCQITPETPGIHGVPHTNCDGD